MKRAFKVFQYTALTMLMLLISSCASLHTELSAADYLQLAHRSQGIKQQRYLLEAVDAYLRAHQVTQANAITKQLAAQSLPPELQATLQLQQAEIALHNQQINRALNRLHNTNYATLTHAQQIRYFRIFAQADVENDDSIGSLLKRQQLGQLLTDTKAQKQNLWAAWKSLQTLEIKTLDQEAAQTPSSYLKGWLTLTSIIKQSEAHPGQLTEQLTQWRATYPDHPANALLPEKLQHLQYTQPRHIALLLPLSGRYAPYAKAIRNGFFAAYYYQKKNLDLSSTISVFDTTQQNIKTLYAQAVAQGADFIVGPLDKQDVLALKKIDNLTVPVLTLNTLPANIDHVQKNVYEFGLSPTDEAEQAATQVRKAQLDNVIIIAPSNDLGKRVVDAFEKQWQSLNGRIIATMRYTNQQTLSNDIRALLNVDLAYRNKDDLQKILRKKVRYLPRRREDFDSIFLVANPAMARQIQPLLQFYFAGDIPVYATSEVYPSVPNPHRDQDLDGILFCDIPWVLGDAHLKATALSNIKQRIQELWPQSATQYARFYALGVDALMLSVTFNKMQLLPQLGIPGATGTLFLTPQHHLYRQLLWAKIQNGKAQVLQ